MGADRIKHTLEIQHNLLQRGGIFLISLILQYCHRGSDLNFTRTICLRTGTHMSGGLECGGFLTKTRERQTTFWSEEMFSGIARGLIINLALYISILYITNTWSMSNSELPCFLKFSFFSLGHYSRALLRCLYMFLCLFCIVAMFCVAVCTYH